MRRRLAVAAQLAATCLIGCVNIVPGWAGPQTPAATGASEFEVASVKQLDQSVPPGQNDLSFVGTSGKPFKIAGNRVTITGTLRILIAAAYGIKDFQISAAPPWAGTAIFSITAKTSGDAAPTQEQVRPMLQSLLADRFQVKVHHETKDLPVYHLTQSKKSNSFKPAAVDETFSWNITPGPGGTVRSKATKESIGNFVQLVGVSADRPVVDKTGLTGDIDYEIQFYQQDARTQDDLNRIIVDAVKDQLGFKLESAKDPIDMLVVDRMEKPSEN